MSPLGNVQFSRFTELEVAKILRFGSDGLLEVMVPMTVSIRFDEKRERLITDPFFWYFFGFMDLSAMQFRAPVFPVPSEVIHASADPRPHGDLIRFTFDASMDRHSRDRWRPYACDPAEVAGRVIEFLGVRSVHRQSATARAAAIQPGTILVGRAA